MFPARDLAVDPRTLAVKCHHLHPSGVQRAITAAVRTAGITQRATAHTLRAAFAHRLKEAGYQLDDIQKRMGHADIRTTHHYLESQAPAHKRRRGTLSSKRRVHPTTAEGRPGCGGLALSETHQDRSAQ